MSRVIISCFILFQLCLAQLALGADQVQQISTENENIKILEEKIKTADELWLKMSPRQAVPMYENLLENLQTDCEPFRSLIILRLVYAHFNLGNNERSIKVLDQLNKMNYVPEHHALVADELRTVISGEPNPGHQKTKIPDRKDVKASIYVDARADASGDGSKNNPLKTLHEAVKKVRYVRDKKVGAYGSVEIVMAPGTYPQKNTIYLYNHDRGLIIRSGDPENPAVITAETQLHAWKKVSNKKILSQLPEAVRDKVLVCTLYDHGIESTGKLVFGGFSSTRTGGPGDRLTSFPVPEFFYDGAAQTMARWPNDSLTVLPIESPPQRKDARYTRWAKEQNLWLYGYWKWDWADAYEKVAHIKESGQIVLEPPTNYYGFRKSLGCAINALCELDHVGEWYLDTREGLVYFLPPEEFDPKKCSFSTYGTIIKADHCQNLQLRDLQITGVRGDALIFNNCSDLILAKLKIRNCSGNGVKIYDGKRHLIHSCDINSMGRGGIEILAGDWQNLVPANSIIENCSFSDLSRIDHTYTQAIYMEGMDIAVRHNSFSDLRTSAIRVETCDALIELNYFYNCLYESGDQGAIDVYGTPLYRGNVVRWNYFDRIINNNVQHGTADVRLDDMISGYCVAENILYKGSDHGHGAVQVNQGNDNYVEGNIIIDWHKAFTGWTRKGESWKERVTTHDKSSRLLLEADWQSEAWLKKYPMVRDLFNGDGNTNYLIDNQQFGYGEWGDVKGAMKLGNIKNESNFHGDVMQFLEPVLVPWHPIPLDQIGPYDSAIQK